MGFAEKDFINVGGCWIPRDYKWIQFPCSSFPSGGIFNKPPSYYQDYERERRKFREKFRKEQEEKQKEKFRRFFHGFFGFDEPDFCEEKKDNDYPYCVFGLKRSASDEDVKKAYRKSILKAHPDKGGSNELFRKVREAWNYFLATSG
tara:strand:- start:266 stop:706 length:441 start_codon:yes stop_codon:yes gene_type:complete